MAEKIKVTFLGTGSAVPTARRNHTAIVLTFKDEMILFDCGEGTQRQFRKAKLNLCKVTKILISHWHGDHVLGLPGLFYSMIMNGYNKELEVYGPKGSKKKMQEYLTLFGINPDSLKLKVFEVEKGIFFEGKEFDLESYPMEHNAPTNGYSFIVREKNRLDRKKLEKLGIPNSPLMAELAKGKKVKIAGKTVDGKKLLYKEPARKFSFIVDSMYNANAVKLSKDANVLACDSSFSAEEQETAAEHFHMTSKDAATIAKKAKVKTLALIHLSQRYDAVPKLILSEAKKTFKDSFVPEDLDSVEI